VDISKDVKAFAVAVMVTDAIQEIDSFGWYNNYGQ